MVTNAVKVAVVVALCAGVAGAILAQTGPPTGPTVPGQAALGPKIGESLVFNPTLDECRVGWRPGLRWTRKEFDTFCRQFKRSK
jgi:hypothetical protein